MTNSDDRTRNLGRVLDTRRIVALIAIALINLLISLWMGQQAYSWMPPQASAESLLIDKLFSFMTAVGTFIFIGVMGTILYATIFQRAAKYDISDGPAIEGNVPLEIIWTALPILLILWIGTVSFQTYDQMSILGDIAPSVIETPKTVPGEPQTQVAADSAGQPIGRPIEVTSKQWSWEFYYPEQNVRSTELHLPIDQRAHFKLTSEDVLHGFYVPAFRVKQDIVPGKVIDFAFTPIREGRYRLRDSEYSGTYFAANQTNVVVESEDDYQQWLQTAASMSPTPAENVSYEEFNRNDTAVNLGWATVKPAPAPIVNYSSSEKDSHE